MASTGNRRVSVHAQIYPYVMLAMRSEWQCCRDIDVENKTEFRCLHSVQLLIFRINNM